MMKNLLPSLFMLLAAVSVTTDAAAQTYTWGNVSMGGGGFVSGLIASKKEPNLMYARTDVGGAYRWNATGSRWISLLDWCSDAETGYQGVESLAIDPQNPNRLYMLVGTSYFNSGKTAILRSSDYGATFSITDVTAQFKAHGNGAGRQNGERLVVDPNDGNILLCGTRRNGLFKSANGGATWSNTSSLGTVTTPNDNGIGFVLYDSASGVAGTATPTVFLGVSTITANNLFVSTDGGSVFAPIAGAPTTLMPQKAVITSDRQLLITYADKEGPGNAATGQVWKYNILSGVWTNITPTGTNYPYAGISVDPVNPQRIIISTINKYLLQYGPATGGTYGDRFYLSTDGGTTWRNLIGSGIALNPNGCTWISGQSMHWTGSIQFDPFNTNKAFVESGNGVFVCNDLSASTTTWTFLPNGMEETVPNDMVSIPEGPMFSVISDYDGFKHTDVTQYAPIHIPRMGTSNGIVFASLNPNKLARVGSRIYYTTDQGSSWTQSAVINGSGGKLAMSADGNVLLHGPNGSTTTYRSTDNGSSWSACTGLNVSSSRPVADPVNPNKFYAYNTTSGFMTVSTDGGASFVNTVSLGTNGSKIIRTAPGKEGHLWVPNNGLKRSVDGGLTFTPVSGPTYCGAVGLGKEAPGASYYTIYIWGTVGGVVGVYRSTNEGATWTRVNDSEHEYGGIGNGQFIMGDMNVYGRVYMSTVGRGIAYAELSSPLFVNFGTFSGLLKDNNKAELKWVTLTESNNNHFELQRSTNGRTFTTVGTVSSMAANGNSSLPLTYNYVDDVTGLTGVVYYRLKQIDREGKSKFSTVLSLNISTKNNPSIQVFPNPAFANNLNLKVILNVTQNVNIRFVNMLGETVYSSGTMQLNAGTNLVDLSSKVQLNKGVYVVEILDNKGQKMIGRSKVVIQ